MSSHENHQTESVVIGALLDAEGPVLKSTGRALLTATGLEPGDFTHPALRAFLGAIQALSERDRPVDAQTVWSLAKDMPGVPKAGHKRLDELQTQNTCNLDGLQLHVGKLKQLARRRSAVAMLDALRVQLDVPGEDLASFGLELDAFSRRFTSVEEDFYQGSRDYLEIAEEWGQFAEGKRFGFLPTGIEVLDQWMGGGWVENLNIIGGASSVGKSSLIAPSILNALKAGHRIAVFGLEDGPKAFHKRFLARELGIPVGAVCRSRLNEYQETTLNSASAELYRLSEKLFSWKPKDGERITSGQLVQLCKRAVHQHKVRAIFIDHGLEVEYEAKHKGEELRIRMDRCFSVLRSLAHSTHTPIIVAVHFNREGAKLDAPPRQEHFAECAGIERMSRLSLGLWRREKDPPDQVRCTIIKNTEGARDVNLKLKRHTQQALISNAGGEEYDFPSEKKAESEKQPRWAGVAQ